MNENMTDSQDQAGQESQTTEDRPKAIQFQITYTLVDRAAKYIAESRNEMIAAEGESEWSEEKIDETLADMEKLKSDIRNMEVDNINNTIEWTSPTTGQQEEVLLRDVDPIRFDHIDGEYNRLMAEFRSYVTEHTEKLFSGDIPLE